MVQLSKASTGITLFLVITCCSFLSAHPAAPSSPHSVTNIVNVAVDSARAEQKQSVPVVIEYWEAYTHQTGIKLVWSVFAEKDIDGFRIYRLGRGDSAIRVLNKGGVIPAWQQSYIDNDVAPATKYFYLLGVVFGDGTEFVTQPVEAHSSDAFLFRAVSALQPLQD